MSTPAQPAQAQPVRIERVFAPLPVDAREPRPGCSTVTHGVLGWCGNCPGLSLATEAVGWRIGAMGAPLWTYAYATQVTACAQ